MVTGPCNWDIQFNDCCECWDELDPAAKQRALNYATTILWAATGRQFGTCESTVRPCGRTCNSNNTAGYFWSDGVYVPYILNGVWRNCFCGCGTGPGCCTCEPHCQVYLPGPVQTITEVTVDGFLIDPSAYRVDNARWLVRTDGDCWPLCQDYSVDAGLGIFNDNTMTVTYGVNEAPPAALLDAAATLACEFAKACRGQPCRLPARASTIARQGVQLTFQNIDVLIAEGFTGIPEVDQVIRAYNPMRLARPMRVFSPDLPKSRTVTIP